jgi:hypothetical protein
MRTVAIGLLTGAGVALSIPANAQGVYVGAGPVGVGVGAAPGYYDGPGYREPYRERSTRIYSDDYAYAGECRVKIIRHRDGRITRVRRCD